jgi:hypothetical protein
LLPTSALLSWVHVSGATTGGAVVALVDGAFDGVGVLAVLATGEVDGLAGTVPRSPVPVAFEVPEAQPARPRATHRAARPSRPSGAGMRTPFLE